MDRSNTDAFTKLAVDTLTSDKASHQALQHRADQMLKSPAEWPEGLRREWDSGALSRRDATAHALGREIRNVIEQAASTAHVEDPIISKMVGRDSTEMLLGDFMRYAVDEVQWADVARNFVPEDQDQ